MMMHCNATDILTEARLSVTAHRVEVLSILIRSNRLMSAIDIAAAVKNKKRSIG